MHRDSKLGPAVTRNNGDLEYWNYGQLHREDDPAIVRADGAEEWYLFGQRISQTKFHEYKNAKPAVKDRWGEEWYLFGQRIPQNKFHEYKNAKRNTEK